MSPFGVLAVRGSGALAGVFLCTGLLLSAELRLGVVGLAEPPRPGYHRIGAIERGSPADEMGLKPGDVIISIDGKIVNRPEDVRSEIRNKDRLVILYHDGKNLYEVVANLKRDEKERFGAKVVGKPERRKIPPPGEEK